ncbi:MAG TPA: SDR family oxidoreductase [Actinomycetota bacterium]|nr:SDR family oxidoreductase [Actinomycetota bacterium]
MADRAQSWQPAPMDLTGRTALVTGASSGIGRATAIALARRGVDVKATGRDIASLEALRKDCAAEVLAADLSRADEADRVAHWAGPVDVLVNNAGFGWAGRLSEMDVSQTEELIRVNLAAPIRLAALLVPGMVERGVGHLVNVSSIAGHVGVRFEAVYSATKAGLLAFSESLRYELAGSGVWVTVVSPGAVRTAFFQREGRAYERTFPRPVRAERVADALIRAIEQNRPQVFVPRWMAFPAWLRGAWPGLYRRLASRFG